MPRPGPTKHNFFLDNGNYMCQSLENGFAKFVLNDKRSVYT